MIEVVAFLTPYILVSLLLGFIVLWGLGLLGAVPGFPTWGELLQALARHSSIFRSKVKQVFRDFGSRWAQARKYARSKLPNEKIRLAATALVGLSLVGTVVGGWYLLEMHEGAELGANAYSTATLDRSIAVMPFENMGGEESRRFTEGVHDDLLARLSNVSELQVGSRSSVQQYRHSEMTAGEIASELGVRWILQGGVQRMGDQIQVNVQLIDTSTDTQVWANTYRRELTTENLFEVENEITKKIARALEADLTTGERQRVERHPTEDLDAYRLYVQGRGFLDRRTEAGMRTAIDYFRRTLERDSAYAQAWAGLAEATAQLGASGYAPGDSVYPEAWEAAQRALDLDPTLAEAHALAGFLHMYRLEIPAALREVWEALRLGPSLPQGHRRLGHLLHVLGWRNAMTHLRRAVELNPKTPEAYADLGWAMLVEGQHEEALSLVRRAKATEPGYPFVHHLEILALYHLGRLDEARSSRRQARPWSTWPSWYQTSLALLQAAEGDTARARQTLDQLRESEEHFLVGVVHAALEENDAALRAFERVERWGVPKGYYLRYSFPRVLDSLRDDPRYRELLREVNRAWGLNPDGSLPDSMDVWFDAQTDE